MSTASSLPIFEAASRLGSVQEYYFSKKLREIANMRAEGHQVINLGIGSPDLAPHKAVIAELHDQSLQDGNHAYQSYSGIPELRNAFANWYRRFYQVNLDPDGEILPLIGSKEGIVHIAMSFLEKGTAALVPNPGYPAYRTATRLAGADIIEYSLSASNNWFPDLEALEQQDLTPVKIMWVNYPNMPTGTKASPTLFKRLVQFAQKHQILLVNDNPYSFILNKDYLSILSVPGAKTTALELNSLSKSHNMAGWRIGMLAGHSALIQTVLRFKSNMDSGMFRPLQLAAVKALQLSEKWYNDQNAIYQKRKQKASEILTLLQCEWSPDASGMFIWAKTPSDCKDGFALSDEVLYKHHVFITPGGIFGSQGNHYIRISLCAKEALFEEAIQRIKTGENRSQND